MEVEVPLAFNASRGPGQILCASCGSLFEPNNAGICINCLRNSVDITESVPKQASLNYCKQCNRYLSPPNSWLLAEFESRELLAICLRRMKGLKEVRLVDAGFVWTEPHSKRLRLKLTVQKEVLTATILQQVFEVEIVVVWTQCPDCARLAAKNTWRALVQVRQKVDHKRTFLYLEQLILKYGADKDTLTIKEVRDGLDFFYASRQHAQKMVDFLTATVPVKVKTSEQLISLDTQNSTTNQKYTHSVEIIPICKDDILCLPKKIAQSLAGIGQICLCSRIANAVHMIDPITLQTAEITAPAYWRNPFSPLSSAPSGTIEFVVLDIEPSHHPPVTANRGRFLLADAQVTPVSSNMDSDQIYHTRTHLGSLLKAGDTCLGYLLTSSNFNDDAWDDLNTSRPDSIPQVVLVRKTYPQRQKKSKPRKWRLKSIAKEVDPDANAGLGRAKAVSGGRRGATAEQQKAEADYERFLQDLEEDDELRSAVNLYKAKSKRTDVDNMDTGSEMGDSVADTDDGEMPKIDLSELLDDFDSMQIIQEDVAEEED